MEMDPEVQRVMLETAEEELAYAKGCYEHALMLDMAPELKKFKEMLPENIYLKDWRFDEIKSDCSQLEFIISFDTPNEALTELDDARIDEYRERLESISPRFDFMFDGWKAAFNVEARMIVDYAVQPTDEQRFF